MKKEPRAANKEFLSNFYKKFPALSQSEKSTLRSAVNIWTNEENLKSQQPHRMGK